MPRGIALTVLGLVLAAGLCYWGLPHIYRKFVGESLQVRVKYLRAEDVDGIEYKDALVSRTVVDMQIMFPLGTAPERASLLVVRNDTGNPVTVNWEAPAVQDDDDQRVTRWTVRAFLPLGFRYGRLCDQVRDLGPLRLPPVPFGTE